MTAAALPRVEVRWCRIHGKPEHHHVLVCNVCLEPLDGDGQPTCQATCNGPHFMRYADSQDTWRCIEYLLS